MASIKRFLVIAKQIGSILFVAVPLLFGAVVVFLFLFPPTGPPDIPIYPNSQNVKKTVREYGAFEITFETEDALLDVDNYYARALSEHGWKPSPCFSHKYSLGAANSPSSDSKWRLSLNIGSSGRNSTSVDLYATFGAIFDECPYAP